MQTQISTKLTRINELNKFKFVLSVRDESESIQIPLEPADENGNSQSASASDYLYMLEKGSPLWNTPLFPPTFQIYDEYGGWNQTDNLSGPGLANPLMI